MSSEVRRPRAYLTVSGGRQDVLSMEIHLGREAKSDTMHAKFPMGDGMGESFWCDTPKIEIKGFITDGDGAGAKPLFTGNVTTVRPDWDARTIDIDCHDKSKKMQEKKSLSEPFKNKKSKEVIEEVAKRNGLKVQVKSDTSKAGRKYDIDEVHHPREITDWDLIHQLADAEGLSVTLDDDTLVLETEGEENYSTLRVVYVRPTAESYAQGTFMSLSGDRNLDTTEKTTVKVSSWDPKTMKKTEAKKTLSQSTGLGSDGDGITYEYQIPNVKEDKAVKIAEKRLRRATKQERQIVLEIPGVNDVTARMKLDLSGTGTSFDQEYQHESVEHRVNEDEGWRIVVTAKSASKDRKVT